MSSLGLSMVPRSSITARKVKIFSRGPVQTKALFGFGGGKSEKSEKEIEKEEQWKAQQEVLNRRRSDSWQGEVRERER